MSNPFNINKSSIITLCHITDIVEGIFGYDDEFNLKREKVPTGRQITFKRRFNVDLTQQIENILTGRCVKVIPSDNIDINEEWEDITYDEVVTLPLDEGTKRRYRNREDFRMTMLKWRNFNIQLNRLDMLYPYTAFVDDNYRAMEEERDKIWATIESIISDKQLIEKRLVPQYITNLNDLQRDKLFRNLIDKKYIAEDTNEESFLWIFGGTQRPKSIIKIKWIKTNLNIKVHLNKRALLDLFTIIGISYKEQRDHDKIDELFSNDKGEPLKYKSGNYNEFDKVGRSEYHEELMSFI